MHISLLLIGLIADLRIIANPLPSDSDLFTSFPANSDNLLSPNYNLFDDQSGTAEITWNNDQSVAGDGIPWESANSDLFLGSGQSDFPYELASSVPCDGRQSSSDLNDGFDILASRDLADMFPGLNELTAPLNELQKSPECANPADPGTRIPKKIPYTEPWPGDDTPPDLFILAGVGKEKCPPSNPIPLYCEGPWVGLDVAGCTTSMCSAPFITISLPRNFAASHTRLGCHADPFSASSTLILEVPRLGAYCCASYVSGDIDRTSGVMAINHPLGRGWGLNCVSVFWGDEGPSTYPQVQSTPPEPEK